MQSIATNANDPHHERHVSHIREIGSQGRNEDKEQICAQEETSCVHKCGGKGHPAWLCPATDDCQFANVVSSGGTAMFQGTSERMTRN